MISQTMYPKAGALFAVAYLLVLPGRALCAQKRPAPLARPGGGNSSKARTYYQEALQEAKAGRSAAAIADLKKSIALDPNRFETYREMDDLLSQQHRYRASVQLWNGYLRLHPGDGRAYCQRGGSYSFLGDVANALRDGDKACSLGNQKCCQYTAQYRRIHPGAVAPPAGAASRPPGGVHPAAPASVAKKPWWRDNAVLSTLAVGAFFAIPILVFVIYWIRSSGKQPQFPKPAPGSPGFPAQAGKPAISATLFAGRSPPANPGYSGMEAAFTPTFDDFWNLQKLTAKNKRLAYGFLCLLGVLLAVMCIWGSLPAGVYAFPGGLLIAGALLPFEDKRKAGVWASNHPDYFSPTTLSIGPEGFHVKSRAEDSAVPWGRVRKIVEKKSHVYFLLGGSAAVVVPKNAFRSPGEAQQFLDSARTYWHSPHQTPPSAAASPASAVLAGEPASAPGSRTSPAEATPPWSPKTGAVIAALFSPIGGGIVACLSLVRMGYKRKGVWVLLLSIAATAVFFGLYFWVPAFRALSAGPLHYVLEFAPEALSAYIFFAIQNNEWGRWRAQHRSVKVRSGWSAVGWGVVGIGGSFCLAFVMLMGQQVPFLHYLMKGDRYMQQKQYQQAEKEYRHAEELRPRSAYAHFGLGYAHLAMRKPDEAIPELREAVKLDASKAVFHRELGRALEEKSDIRDAVPELRTALKIQPNDAGAHFLLGLALESQKDLSGAAAEYRAALALHPGYAPAQSQLAKLSKRMQSSTPLQAP